MSAVEEADLVERAYDALREVVDPEVGLDVVSLGLVYGVSIEDGHVTVSMTMTSPACPLGGLIVEDAEGRLRALEGARGANVMLVWDPPWTPERMSPEARATLGWGD